MMEKISDAHPYLYHYTNEQGLNGILENQCLWATHYKFLNDTSEFQLFREEFEKILYPSRLSFYMKKYRENQSSLSTTDIVKASQIAKLEVDDILKIIYKTLPPEIYITSFCTHKDDNDKDNKDNYNQDNGLLSQWRGYSENGGYAIVFNTSGLDKMLKAESDRFHYDFLHLAIVIYSDDHTELNKELSKHRQNIIDWHEEHRNLVNQKQKKFLNTELAAKALPPIYQLSSCYKHRGFKEENEVRIVAIHLSDDIPNGKNRKERLFRGKNGGLAPYIELFRNEIYQPYDKFLTIKNTKPLPIKKIIVGPHKDKDQRAATLRVKLRNTGIEVTVSDIPYI